MTLPDISSYITFLTNAGTSEFTTADRTILINRYNNDITTAVLDAQDEFDFDDSNNVTYPILTTDIKANQQPYTLPTTTLKIKRLEISYDGTTWVKAEPFDISERAESVNSNEIGDFSTAEPSYDLEGGSLFLYPIPTTAVSAGMKIWISRPLNDFVSADLSDSTKSPGFDSVFHHMLGIGPAMEYAVKANLPQAASLASLYQAELQKLKAYYSFKQEDRRLSFRFDPNKSYK